MLKSFLVGALLLLDLAEGNGCPAAPLGQMLRRDTQASGQEDLLEQFEVDDSNVYMSNAAGLPEEDQNSLKAGNRGPTLLEDFLFRQKITHFDHERVCLNQSSS